MVAVTSGVSLEARRGPLRCGTSALTPAADSACAHRQRVNGEVSNAAATCTWVAALIRINDTAANRRPAVSPASQAKARCPCTKTRPPCSSSIIAAAAPISVAPVGISGRGGWVVITVIVAPPTPPEKPSRIISRPGRESAPTHRQIRSSQHRITDRTRTPCQESWIECLTTHHGTITKWLQAGIGGKLWTYRGVLKAFEVCPEQETVDFAKVT